MSCLLTDSLSLTITTTRHFSVSDQDPMKCRTWSTLKLTFLPYLRHDQSDCESFLQHKSNCIYWNCSVEILITWQLHFPMCQNYSSNTIIVSIFRSVHVQKPCFEISSLTKFAIQSPKWILIWYLGNNWIHALIPHRFPLSSVGGGVGRANHA